MIINERSILKLAERLADRIEKYFDYPNVLRKNAVLDAVLEVRRRAAQASLGEAQAAETAVQLTLAAAVRQPALTLPVKAPKKRTPSPNGKLGRTTTNFGPCAECGITRERAPVYGKGNSLVKGARFGRPSEQFCGPCYQRLLQRWKRGSMESTHGNWISSQQARARREATHVLKANQLPADAGDRARRRSYLDTVGGHDPVRIQDGAYLRPMDAPHQRA